MLAFDLLRLRFAHRVLFRIDMTLISPPAIRVKLRDAKGLQQFLQPQEDVVLAPSKHIRQHLPGVVINGVSQPPRIRFLRHIRPHLIEF